MDESEADFFIQLRLAASHMPGFYYSYCVTLGSSYDDDVRVGGYFKNTIQLTKS